MQVLEPSETCDFASKEELLRMCLRARCIVYVFVGLIHLFARTAYVDAVVDRGGVGDDTRLEFGEAIRMCWG